MAETGTNLFQLKSSSSALTNIPVRKEQDHFAIPRNPTIQTSILRVYLPSRQKYNNKIEYYLHVQLIVSNCTRSYKQTI